MEVQQAENGHQIFFHTNDTHIGVLRLLIRSGKGRYTRERREKNEWGV